MKIFFVSIFLLIEVCGLFGQGEIDEEQKIIFRDEQTVAVFLNSNGFSGNYRYARRIVGEKKFLYDVDLAFIKHPKEVKLSVSQLFSSGNFKYGKLNEFYSLRLGVGIQNELFKKTDRGSVSIRHFYIGGITLGFLKPIYYKVWLDEDSDGLRETTKIVKFGEHIMPDAIQGKASFFKGFNEISLIPGVFGKTGFMFEFGKYDRIINAIEIGATLGVYLKEAEIMAIESNSRFFLTLSVGYRFGRAIDVRFKKRNRSELEEILVD